MKLWCALLVPLGLWAAVFGSIRGVIHDPSHRPVQGASVILKSTSCGLFADRLHRRRWSVRSDFRSRGCLPGDRVTHDGFAPGVAGSRGRFRQRARAAFPAGDRRRGRSGERSGIGAGGQSRADDAHDHDQPQRNRK